MTVEATVVGTVTGGTVGQVVRGVRIAEQLKKSQHNLFLFDGKRMDLKGRSPFSTGHFNKTTQVQYRYPHVVDPSVPGNVRAATPSDFLEVTLIYSK